MAYTSGMTEERDLKYLPCRAGAAIGTYRILQGGTDADEVIQATAGSQFPVGVSGDGGENGKASYEENDRVAARYEGIAYVKMSGAGSRFQRVMATTGGMGIAHTSQDNVWTLGEAMEAWEDGQEVPVLIDRQFIGEAVGS